ncbi:5-formyltetrahydrofolate cyclo-ligase [Limibacter armeniacum]|uniref:5-formyltetrahydrofolate cyclo-ligase n=1 Tax=Limibacter armeniacum TaxID=466084 RepID=UPI002FE6B7FE
MNSKQTLRKNILSQRKALSDAEVTLHSTKIVEQLKKLIEEKDIKTVHTYLPIQNEVDTLPLIKYALECGLQVVVPKTLENRSLKHCILTSMEGLVIGKFNTLYPKTEEEYKGTYDMIIVPAVAFDHLGNRIGYGAGYYDTFLQDHHKAIKVGVAYPFQVVENITAEAHDIPVDLLICSEEE